MQKAEQQNRRVTYARVAGAGVDWYIRHGRYPHDRVKNDGNGVPYVIADAVWNAKNKGLRHEVVDRFVGAAMDDAARSLKWRLAGSVA